MASQGSFPKQHNESPRRHCQLNESRVEPKQGSAGFAQTPAAALHTLKERARSSR